MASQGCLRPQENRRINKISYEYNNSPSFWLQGDEYKNEDVVDMLQSVHQCFCHNPESTKIICIGLDIEATNGKNELKRVQGHRGMFVWRQQCTWV